MSVRSTIPIGNTIETACNGIEKTFDTIEEHFASRYIQPVMCKCNYYATYRCRYTGQTIGLSIPGHPLISTYYHRSCQRSLETSYIACDKCVKENTILYFMHIPGGWKENNEYPGRYENVNLDWKIGPSKIR